MSEATPQRGQFITLEGGEGAGKSTQAKLLARQLEAAGHHVVLTREPGGSAGAEIMRHVILSGAASPLGPTTEALLFAAARLDHLNQTILPALTRGDWVICDRFSDSTFVYQGIAGKVDPAFILHLETLTVGPNKPDLTLILDLPAEEGLARAKRRSAQGDRFEDEALDFHQAIRAGFKAVAIDQPERCVLIDASKDPERVAERIWRAVSARLPVAMGAGAA